jgi:hypothetical protein
MTCRFHSLVVDGTFGRNVVKTFASYRDWYRLLTLREHTDVTLQQLTQAGVQLLRLHKTFNGIKVKAGKGKGEDGQPTYRPLEVAKVCLYQKTYI